MPTPRRRAILVWTCLLSFTIVADRTTGQTTFESEIQVLERLAEERYAEGDLERAAETYLEIAAKQSSLQGQAQALFMAAWLTQLDGDSAAALSSLTRSLTLSPDQTFDASLYNREFEVLYAQALDLALKERQRQSAEKTANAVREINAGRDGAARQLLEAATRLDPDNPAARYNLALLDLRAGADEEAMAGFERAVALSYGDSRSDMDELRSRALTSMASIYQRQDRLGDAEQSYLEATRANPREPLAWRNLGLLQHRQQRFADAVTALERAHELLPDDRGVIGALVDSLLKSGRASQASTTLKNHLARVPEDAEMWQQLGRIAADRGETEAAIEALQNSAGADAGNRSGIAIESIILLASVHLQRGDAEAAMTAANQAIGWNRDSADAWSVLGQAQLAADQLAPATASLARAAELDPSSAERQLILASTLQANRQLGPAEAAYLRALTLDPGSSEARANLEVVRRQMARDRAIASGKQRAPRPIAPKKIGLEFAGIDYRELQLRGALVKQVNKKSPAARAGLRKGDLILWIGDYSVLSGKDFFQYLKRSPPGDRLQIEYLRDGRIHDAELQLR